MDNKLGRIQLNCFLIRETLNNNREIVKKFVFKNASLLLGRNELGGILLSVACDKFNETVLLEDFNVHNKFLKDGKASIVMNKEKIQYMISNCPPEQLFSFLRTLFIKNEALKEKKQMSPSKKKIFPSLTRCISEVSPLTNKDINVLNKLKSLKPQTLMNDLSKQMKRKCEMTPDNKENFSQKLSPLSTVSKIINKDQES
ncbi:hypothetical protein HELRODRAFT_160065 [Helobdella robusta]|uniref:PIF1/LRR1 pleckstrin homology domain-containing protein n=1 Tax=Helobdella robusta TaxID=6412 RepID=T1EPQ7_HELRO|nr:hypothetical protein HELRODRAFT_160065 [Helobdella robusta]ESO05964.1 hypothetical protein HELRODRAFT_160065 [Helobdella robusta]